MERKSRKSGRMMEINLLECIARIELVDREILDEMVPEARSQGASHWNSNFAKGPEPTFALKWLSPTFSTRNLTML